MTDESENPRPDAEWIPIAEGGPFDGRKVLARLRYPDRLNDEFSSADPKRMRAALGQIVVMHNGWIDQYGIPLPPASTDGFWGDVSQEEFLLTLKALGEARKRNLAELFGFRTNFHCECCPRR